MADPYCSFKPPYQIWIDVYTSFDIERTLEMVYKIMEFIEIWHYHNGGEKIFKEFISNIMRKKLECSGFSIS